MSHVLVTGASGFVGSAACRYLKEAGYKVSALSRSGAVIPGVENIAVPDLSNHACLKAAIAGKDCIVHTAARVHVMKEKSDDPLGEFRKTNRDLTQMIAEVAVECGVKRLIFLSTIKVFGEKSAHDRPFRASDPARPVDPYSVSKWEAEQLLVDFASRTGLEVVIIRPPMVYGPGVRANFERLVRIIQLGIPLPFGEIENARSLVSVYNLSDLIRVCIDHPRAPGKTFTVSDGEPLSTLKLVKLIGRALNRPARTFGISEKILWIFLKVIGKRSIATRLLTSLHVDITDTTTTLNWKPSQNIEAAIGEAVNSILRKEKVAK